MATRTGIYKQAHLLLKQNATDIAVTDDSQFVNTLDEVYDAAINYMLEQGLWNFATRTVAIEASVDVEAEFGFTYVIIKPEDYAGRIVSLSADDRFSDPLNDYHEEGGIEGFIFCDVDPLYIRYISNGASYGLNLAAWPWTFTRAVEYELAWRVAPHLTGMGESAMTGLEKRKIQALRDARSKDALNQASERPPAGRLARSRGGRSIRWRGW